MHTITQQRQSFQVCKYRRTKTSITADILGVLIDYGIDGALISTISRRANLSHNAALEKCQRLEDAGLVESIKDKRNHIYRINEKGIKFFFEFQRFLGIVKEISLKY
jgi:predicted transcriptional regulator